MNNRIKKIAKFFSREFPIGACIKALRPTLSLLAVPTIAILSLLIVSVLYKQLNDIYIFYGNGEFYMYSIALLLTSIQIGKKFKIKKSLLFELFERGILISSFIFFTALIIYNRLVENFQIPFEDKLITITSITFLISSAFIVYRSNILLVIENDAPDIRKNDREKTNKLAEQVELLNKS